jgi:hypothetical protein
MLENSRKPCGKRVERRWIEQEIRHHDEWHEDQQSIDPVPNGWRQWIRWGRKCRLEASEAMKRNSEASAGPPCLAF